MGSHNNTSPSNIDMDWDTNKLVNKGNIESSYQDSPKNTKKCEIDGVSNLEIVLESYGENGRVPFEVWVKSEQSDSLSASNFNIYKVRKNC